MEIQLIRIKELELPVPVDKKIEEDEKTKDIRNRFLSGKEVAKEELAFLVGTSRIAAGNGNCNAC